MGWWWIPAGLAAIALVLAIWGALLPRGHRCTVAREHPATPERLWALLTDVEAFPRWRPEVRSVEIRERDVQDRPLAWTEHTRFGPMPMRVAEADPPHRLVGAIDTDALPFEGTWTFEVEGLGDRRSRLRITEDGAVKNVIFRFLARHVFGHDRTMKAYHDAVAAAVTRNVKPDPSSTEDRP